MYLRADGSDTGDCTNTSPCATFNYAFSKVTAQRSVVHLMGGLFNVGDNTVVIGPSVYIDGEGTEMLRQTAGPVFTSSGAGSAILSELVFIPGSDLAISAGSVELHHVHLFSKVALTGGTLEIARSTLETGGAVNCTNAANLSIHDSLSHIGLLSPYSCNVTLQRNRFETDSSITLNGGAGLEIVENNVIVAKDYFTDGMLIGGRAGTRVRFNTFVNLSGVDMGATSLSCSPGTEVSSNIFAWHSHAAPCASRYSLFDEFIAQQPGEGNKSGSVASFFVDLAGGDFHLAPSSPAKSAAEPNLDVPTDLEGTPRPTTGQPDIGAYEAP